MSSDDEALVSIGWDLGVCPNLASGACSNPLVDCCDVVDCVQCGGEAAVDQTLGLAYDELNLRADQPRLSGPAVLPRRLHPLRVF